MMIIFERGREKYNLHWHVFTFTALSDEIGEKHRPNVICHKDIQGIFLCHMPRYKMMKKDSQTQTAKEWSGDAAKVVKIVQK